MTSIIINRYKFDISHVYKGLYNKRNNTFNITYMQSEDSLKADWMPINIYEFVFKCKDWALSKGYFIYSTHELSFIKSISLETIETFANGQDTEIECIIKACEWVVNKVNK